MTATQDLNAVFFAACLSEQAQASLGPISAKAGTGFIAFHLLSLEIIIFLSDILVRCWWSQRSCLGCCKEGVVSASEDKLDQRHMY